MSAPNATRNAVVRVGTRRSLLATTQAGHVADMVRDRLGREVEMVEITTDGDRKRFYVMITGDSTDLVAP